MGFVTGGVDMSVLKRKLRLIHQSVAEPSGASDAALTEIMQGVMKKIVQETPTDTNRMVRGFTIAANDVGLGPFAVPDIQPSKYLPLLRSRLSRQLRRLSIFANFIKKKDGENSKNYRKIVKNRDRAKQELGSLTGTSILILNKGRGVEFTVRNKVYGGQGLRSRTPTDGLRFTIINKEPHAIIRERLTRTVASALNIFKRAGGRRARRTFLAKIKKKSGVGSAS